MQKNIWNTMPLGDQTGKLWTFEVLHSVIKQWWRFSFDGKTVRPMNVFHHKDKNQS